MNIIVRFFRWLFESKQNPTRDEGLILRRDGLPGAGQGHFPNDDAATKLIWLALRNITAKWERGAIYWKNAMNQFAILYEGRFTKPTAS